MTSQELVELVHSEGDYHRDLTMVVQLLQPEVVFDIGTLTGGSACALAAGSSFCVVHTFDVENRGFVSDNENIKVHLVNLCDGEVAKRYERIIGLTELAFIDVDPHDGLQEPRILENVLKYEQKLRFVFADDISYEPMQSWWNSITYPKLTTGWHGGQGFGVIQIRK